MSSSNPAPPPKVFGGEQRPILPQRLVTSVTETKLGLKDVEVELEEHLMDVLLEISVMAVELQ
jgi:hypothetical protein